MKEIKQLEQPLQPIYDEKAKVLILGTFPSVKSREAKFYYSHPQNRFWNIIAALTNEKVPNTIEEKKLLLSCHGIALWDVIKSCEIIGSSDSSIKNVIPVDLSEIFLKAKIKQIYANGGKAYILYQKYMKINMEITKLPSTSPANARYSLEKLLEEWKVLKEWIF